PVAGHEAQVEGVEPGTAVGVAELPGRGLVVAVLGGFDADLLVALVVPGERLGQLLPVGHGIGLGLVGPVDPQVGAGLRVAEVGAGTAGRLDVPAVRVGQRVAGLLVGVGLPAVGHLGGG